MEWAQILVIILAVFLALFLLLAIILVALLIKVTRQIKAIATTAQRAANGLEHMVSGATKYATPLALFKLLKKHAGKIAKVTRKSKGE